MDARHNHLKKNLLLNCNIYLQTRIIFLRAYIRSRLTFNCQSWVLTTEQSNKIDATWRTFLRKMIRGGFRRQEDANGEDYRFYYRNEDIHRICNTHDVSEFINTQQRNYAAHLVRADNCSMTKKLLFQEGKCTKRGRNTNTLLKKVLENLAVEKQAFVEKAMARVF